MKLPFRNDWMYAIGAVLLCVIGCIQPASDQKPPADTLDGVARQSIQTYAKSLADLCDKTSDDIASGQYKAQSQIWDNFHLESDKIRHNSFKSVEDRLGLDFPAESAMDSQKGAAAFKAMANGFRRVK